MRFSLIFLQALWAYKKNYVPSGQSPAQKIERIIQNTPEFKFMVYPAMECARSLPPLTKKKEFRIINPEISFHKANRMWMVYLEAVLDEVMPIAVKKIATDLFAFRDSHPDKSMTFEAFLRLRTHFHGKFFPFKLQSGWKQVHAEIWG